jgi:hypothetical protein
MVASQTGVAGNINAALSLNFSHICTAVEFAVGNSDIFDGSIDEITLSGVANEATYSYATSSWSTPTGSASYTITPASDNSFGDSQRLVLLPQELADDAQLQITYSLNGESQQRTYTYSLKGQTWSAANCYRYTLNMAPEMTISFSETKLDAHYVMTTANITVAGIKGNWSIVGSGSSGTEAVSLQLESEVNDFVSKGYWTANSRGDSIVGKGAGSYTVRIFAPENVTNKERTYTFSLRAGGTTLATNSNLKQYCPAWVGDYGWEQVDDGQSGAYGFARTKQSVYILLYGYSPLSSSNYKKSLTVLTTLISDYGASGYVDQNYHTLLARTYIVIYYSKLPSDASNLGSREDGLANTQAMSQTEVYNDLCPFEIAIQNTMKIESGKETENMFREAGSDNDSYWERQLYADYVKEDETDVSGILDFILKKNAYILEESTSSTSVTRSVKLRELKWYLPAVDQNTFPSGASLGEYWSSTSAGSNQAYLLNGTSVSSSSSHSVRAVRNLN